MDCFLALEDGTVMRGRSFGAKGETFGEVVFNTSMSGYQEILTDPSYKGQIVTMTYPLIGNYGINEQDVESWRPQVEGFVVKEACRLPSNWRSSQCLHDYLKQNGVVGIEGIDTRALVRRIRIHGAMKGIISTEDKDQKSLVNKARESRGLVDVDLVKEVSRQSVEVYTPDNVAPFWFNKEPIREKNEFNVVALDFGIKSNILRMLVWSGCRVTVVPASTTAEEVLAYNPDGIFLSNGPGDPSAVHYAIDTVRELIGKRPIFGICLGHQMAGLALGGETYKLKFGHRGGNQPVMNKDNGKVEITSQNHGFCIDLKSLDQQEIELTHINLNDQTLEGLRHKKQPLFSVQYHPEASPGPHDAGYLFENFRRLMEG